ncbi:MAG: prephenate dehydratase [uncultured bacterium (gcode 4)]|uniref:prephenate dehydratase n=1 Tax=uncultured bacterium (gcode 4) TaxID=1234023 RepID=K2F5K3_9BACT|nr:MAG: prephenate dehydratase [uncultured bacterium (gcode 4)]
MKIYYQWEAWAYSNIAANLATKNLSWKIEILNSPTFWGVWEEISEWIVWVLPIENSYAWSIHENLYNFLRYDYKIIWEVNLEVNHCLISKEKDLSEIKKVYSHPQALSQCYNYLKSHEIESEKHSNTAAAAKMVSESEEKWIWAISSDLSAEIYWLNILERWIQDQKWNKTRFFIVASKNENIAYKDLKNKVTIIFETRNIPASLYKCLWSFATNSINLTKIESLPSLKDPFSYMFWLDFEWNLEMENIKESLKELQYFTKSLKILGEY